MARAFHPHPESHHLISPRTLNQKICIGLGIVFVMLGLGGITMPDLLGMHLSFLHNLIHLASGGLALWSGYAEDPKRAYNFSIGFGAFYGLLGLGGFAFGQPGYPGVGHMEADEHLLRVIPNALEFGSTDHIIHLLISVSLVTTAYFWKRSNDSKGKITVQVQARQGFDPENSVSDLKDSPLGRSDIQRKSDVQRRNEFERNL